MRKIVALFCLFGVVSASMTSCKQEPFNPLDDWKDITLVYGFMNLNDTSHYVRIFKAFLGQEDALIMAQHPDSIYYPEKDLAVVIRQFDPDDNPVDSFVLERVQLPDREPGIFAQKNIIYKFDKIFDQSTERKHILRLEITNLKNGKIITSETGFVYFSYAQPYSTGRHAPRFDADDIDEIVTYANVQNLELADLYINFRYSVAALNGSGYSTRSVKWKVIGASSLFYDPQKRTSSLYYYPYGLYDELEAALSYAPDSVRTVLPTGTIETWGGSEEMRYWINVNKPSGIIIARPTYTNLSSNSGEKDVFGIFTTRYNKRVAILQVNIDRAALTEIDRQF